MTSKCEMGNHLKFFCHCITCAISLSEALLALFKLSMRKVFILKWLVNSWILMSCQPHRKTSGWITKITLFFLFFFLNITIQSKIQVTTQVCLIHCYTVESQPFSHLPIYQCTVTHVLEPTLLLVFIYLRHSPWELIKLKSLLTMSRVTYFILQHDSNSPQLIICLTSFLLCLLVFKTFADV